MDKPTNTLQNYNKNNMNNTLTYLFNNLIYLQLIYIIREHIKIYQSLFSWPCLQPLWVAASPLPRAPEGCLLRPACPPCSQ